MKTLYRARALLSAAIFACTVSHAATEVASDQPAVALAEVGFSLKLPKADNVVFRGAVNFDGAGGPNAQFLYPGAFGVAGLWAIAVLRAGGLRAAVLLLVFVAIVVLLKLRSWLERVRPEPYI